MKDKKVRQLIRHHVTRKPGQHYTKLLQFMWQRNPRIRRRQIERAVIKLVKWGDMYFKRNKGGDAFLFPAGDNVAKPLMERKMP